MREVGSRIDRHKDTYNKFLLSHYKSHELENKKVLVTLNSLLTRIELMAQDIQYIKKRE